MAWTKKDLLENIDKLPKGNTDRPPPAGRTIVSEAVIDGQTFEVAHDGFHVYVTCRDTGKTFGFGMDWLVAFGIRAGIADAPPPDDRDFAGKKLNED